MSRTFKDAPYWLWMAHRCNASIPDPAGPWRSDRAPAGSPYSNPAEWDRWLNLFPDDDAVNWHKARRRSAASLRRMTQKQYRAHVRTKMAHNDWDGIEAPRAAVQGWYYWW